MTSTLDPLTLVLPILFYLLDPLKLALCILFLFYLLVFFLFIYKKNFTLLHQRCPWGLTEEPRNALVPFSAVPTNSTYLCLTVNVSLFNLFLLCRLSNCSIGEEGCASLALALRSNPSYLREFDLSSNKPQDSGVKLLSNLLEDPHCKLEKLK